MYKQIRGIEQGVQILTFTLISISFMTKVTMESNGKRMVFSTIGAGSGGYPYGRKINPVHIIHKSQFQRDCRSKCKTKLLKDDIREYIDNLAVSKNFLNMPQKHKGR